MMMMMKNKQRNDRKNYRETFMKRGKIAYIIILVVIGKYLNVKERM